MNYKLHCLIILIICFISSCQNIVKDEPQHIYGDYYLITGDTEIDTRIHIKEPDGGFVGRIAARVVAYGIIGDSILIGKRITKSTTEYHVLNMKKDDPYAEIEDSQVGKFTKQDFDKWCLDNNVKVRMIEVK